MTQRGSTKTILLTIATALMLCLRAMAGVGTPVEASDLERLRPTANKSALLLRQHPTQKQGRLSPEIWLTAILALATLAAASASARNVQEKKSHPIHVTRPAAR